MTDVLFALYDTIFVLEFWLSKEKKHTCFARPITGNLFLNGGLKSSIVCCISRQNDTINSNKEFNSKGVIKKYLANVQQKQPNK